MSIAIDFDCVLSNTIKKWIQIFNQDYSEKYDSLQLSYNKIKEFDFCKNLNIAYDDSREIFRKCWQQWNQLEPTEFMLSQKIQILSELHGRPDIVTANDPIHREFLEEFLKKHRIRYGSIIFSENKEELDYDVFVDDSPNYARRIFDAGKSVFLYNQPWNQDVVSEKIDRAYLVRAYSLDHIIHILQNK